jgi:O-antigen/teichoic acid export membrane protein
MKQKTFLAGLISRKAQWILSSSLLSKFSGLFLSLIVVRYLSVDDFGLVTLYKTIFLLLVPLIGLGLNHSLLRYGAVASTNSDKLHLFINAMVFGGGISIFIGVVIFTFLPYLPNLYFDSTIFISAYLFYQALFILNCVFSFYRVKGNNSGYSIASSIFSINTLVIASLFIYSFQSPSAFFFGQFASIIVFLSALIYIHRIKIKELAIGLSSALTLPKKHLQYGISVALGGLASQLMLASDNLMLSILGESLSDIGLYGVCSLIFVNLLFIPSVILVTDFVYLSKLSNKKIRKYLTDYWRFILWPLSAICIVFFFWGDIVLATLFGEVYVKAFQTLQILSIGIFMGVMLRVPIGNLLNARGYASFNVLLAISFSIANIVLNYFLIPLYGINGAAIATVLTISVSSLTSLFYLYYKIKA